MNFLIFGGWGLAAILLVVIMYRLRVEQNLLDWLRDRPQELPPDLPAPLDEISRLSYRRFERTKKHKKRLNNYISLFRELIDAMPDAAFVIDKQGRLADFNHHAQLLFHLNHHTDINRPIDHFIRTESIASFWQHIQQNHLFMTRLIVDDSHWLEFNIILLSQGKILVIARDMTRIVDLDLKRKAFIDNASHELKTPITVIRGFLELLSAQNLPEYMQVPMREMVKQIERMHGLVQDMLKLASLEEVESAVKTEEVLLLPFIEEIVASLLPQYPESTGIKIGYVEHITLQVNAEILQSMISNLLVNALVHAHSKNPIEINAACTEEWCLIAVNDDGIGIAPEHISRVTERFYRVDSGRLRATGTGLGLSIVKHGAEIHGGRLVIKSKVDLGSLFTIELPISRVIKREMEPQD